MHAVWLVEVRRGDLVMSRSQYHSGKKRDNCFFCRAFGSIEEHHIIPQRFGGPDEEWNIVGLCGSCHDKLERLYDSTFYEHFGITDEEGHRAFHRTCIYRECSLTVDVYLRLPRGEVAGYCTGCAMQIAGRWWRRGTVPSNGGSALDVVRDRAVKIADGSPLKEAV